MNRKLDGAYFRVCRRGAWRNVCFSDLTQDERKTVLEGRSIEWCISLINHLADSLHSIGDEFDIVGEGFDYDEEQA